ncbi:unnamed protein product [Linum trigynum]|uniref:Uncharacterized protein n=1 Tax=Linum trigynum TaxID=586398 RepID=A0AAV2GCL5_9ROSI
MGDQIKTSIEEMGKSVADNICGALAATMQEVLTQVLKSREQLVIPVMGAAPTTAIAARVATAAAATVGSGARAARQEEQLREGAGTGAGRTGAGARWEEEAAEENSPAGCDATGATWALAAAGGAPGSSTVQRSRAGETGTVGARSAPAPAFSGPGLLSTPTDLAQDKARGKQKMAGYEGEPWSLGPDGEEPWPEEELSFGDPEGWMDPSPEEARWGWVTGAKPGRIGPVTGWPAGQTDPIRVTHRRAVAGTGRPGVPARARSTGTPRGVHREQEGDAIEVVGTSGKDRGPSLSTPETTRR